MIPSELIIMTVLFIGLALLEKKEKRVSSLQYYLLIYTINAFIALIVGEFTYIGSASAVIFAFVIWVGLKKVRDRI